LIDWKCDIYRLLEEKARVFQDFKAFAKDLGKYKNTTVKELKDADK